MGNLGINCDLKSCHLCDNCIFDDDYTDINMEEKKQKKIYCDSCPFVSKLRISTGQFSNYNVYCNNTKDSGSKRLIDVSVLEGHLTSTPCWCKFNKDIDAVIKLGDITLTKKSWDTITPQINFEDIKEGDVYHVSPYDNHERMDIVITKKTEYSASYKILNDKSKGFNINTIYPNTMIMRYLSIHKILSIEVEQVK